MSFLPALLVAASAPPVDAAFFENKVRPLLTTHCQSCHGDKKQKGGLRLDSRAATLAGGETGPAMVPDDAANSLLVQAVRYDADLKMPPKGKLTAAEIETLSTWVAGGAPWPDAGGQVIMSGPKGMDVKAVAAGHWSFQPVRPPTVPADVNPIDHLIRQQLAAAGLKPAPPADKRTLIRRITFDLTGLPPTPAEVDAFLTDDSPEAYPKLVDRLLASPAYGERWGRHWLDLVRYAETHGHEFDFDIPNAWRFRDYVIRAFNNDLPFDRFAREQIAGDLLPPRRGPDGVNEAVVGTGFWLLGEAVHSPVDVRQDQADRMDNRIDVFGKTFLGLTVACARCHDHKFDPIPTRDYYGLFGVAASTRYEQAFIDDPADTDRLLDELAVRRPPLAVEPSAAFAGWMPSGPAFRGPGRTHSGRESAALRGVLRSPTFTISGPVVAVRAAGRAARLRLVIDNFELIRDPIYGGLEKSVNHGDEYRWLTFAVERWKGHAAYLEAIDDGPGYVALADVRFAPPPSDDPTPAPPPPTGGDERVQEIEAKLAVAPRRTPALTDGTGRDERVFVRGNPRSSGEPAPRRFLELFAGNGSSPTSGSGRLELADAVLDPANPLTARVFVNRVWQGHFGTGLVPTPDDFGRQGEPPTHPELLDFLADQFVRDSWRVKPLHRRLLLTDTYRQAASAHPESAEKATTADPRNRLLHRANVRRLEAEAVRDSILAVSGRLDRTAGGPGVPPHLTEHMVGRGRPGGSGPIDGAGRRSVYLQVRRNFPHPLLTAFDLPTPFTTIGRRNVSNVPAQALVLLNNPFVLAEAERWAARGTEANPEARVRRMYAEAFARGPSEVELSAAVGHIAERTPAVGERAAWAELAHALFNAKAFVFVE